MPPDDINAELWNGYTAAFDYFNQELFDGTLPPCVLTLGAKGASTGFFKAATWKKGSQDYHEICLNPALLNRADDVVFQTLVKLMVFLWQHTYGTPNSAGYCDVEFSDKMRSFGLPCDKEYGLNLKFSVDPEGRYASIRPDAMSKFFPLQNFEIQPPKGKRLKFTCPQCGSKVMGYAGVRVICITEECNVEMTKEAIQS